MMPRPLVIPWKRGDAAAALRDREWLVTNGLGGFASGSLLGVPTRRYHGCFVPNLAEPKGRHVLVPRLDELVEVPGGWVNLGGAEFVDGTRQGHTDLHLREFRLEALTPVWTFDVGESVLERSVVMPHGCNTVCVRWRLLEGRPCSMRVRVFVSPRRQDAELVPDDRWPAVIDGSDAVGTLQLRFPANGASLRMAVWGAFGAFVEERYMERGVHFRVEWSRGYDHSEHMHSPGWWPVELRPGEQAAFVATTEASLPAPDADALFRAEHERLEMLLVQARLSAADDTEKRLVLAADPFVVLPGSRRDAPPGGGPCESFRSVIAGYHWFNDWGRDTMISLEGLTLCTRRYQEARAILLTFASYIRDGLVPNLFPEGDREALYHTVDATLWYFHALQRYLAHTGDASLVAELYPALREVIDHHLHGTRFGIGIDPQDALLHAGAEGYQLTWMDAKVDDWVVTPRRGKPVEIQALWYNALRLMAGWAWALGAPNPGYDRLADRVRKAFEARFWSPPHGYLFDVIDGPEGDDARLRPNQIFALSLAHPVLAPEHWHPVLDTVARHLVTPVGLRTLARGQVGYRPHYGGSLRDRDAAYHQGTVWPWLLGHFVDAWIKAHGRRGARALLRAIPGHLTEAGIGTISEVFDAEPPHHPGGCIAQAWSVAESLRAWRATRRREATDG